MKKFLLGAAAAALIIVGASSGANAYDAAYCAAQYGEPNANAGHYWVVSVVQGEEETSSSLVGDLSWAGKSGNAFGTIETTVSSTDTVTCTRYNSQNNVAEVQTAEETTVISSSTQEGVKVCQNAGPGPTTVALTDIACVKP